MFRIGEFSRLANVSVDTLRHYDALGLLTPARTDPWTGYRYYTATQLLPLSRILALKELGFSLEEIARTLHEDVDGDVMRGMLRLQLEAAERDVRVAQDRVARLRARLMLLQQEETMPTYEVVVKPVDTVTIAAIREVVPRIEDMPDHCSRMFDTIAQWLVANKLPFGASLTIYHNDGYAPEQIDTECAFVVPDAHAAHGAAPANGITVRTLEGAPLMATTVVADDFYKQVNGLTPAYHALARWIEVNEYRIVGTAREVFYGSVTHGDLAAEIQIPVAKP